MGEDRVPVAVVGLGHFGRFHARKWHVTEGARLAALVDRDLGLARSLADELGGDIAATDDPRALADLVKAASVAVPTQSHFEVGSALIGLGLHVLLEKPIAATLDEADRLIAAARKRGVILQIGHQERFFFNRVPLDGRLRGPLAITAQRFGVPSGRQHDCSVVLDLMIHDIDLALSRISADLVSVDAEGETAPSGFVETASARLGFADGSLAVLVADRQARERRRVFELDGGTERFRIDFLARSASANGAALPLDPVPPALEADTLLAETTAFLAAIRGAPMRGADGVAGRRALAAAMAIEAAFKR
jgi:predicted dehydrogenase